MKHKTWFFGVTIAVLTGFCSADQSGMSSTGGHELVVAPSGLSPQAALQKIRAAKKSGDRAPWTVRVKPGFYSFDATFELLPEDSGSPDAPVRWVADGGEAVFAGGRPIAGWREEPDGLWSAALPKDAKGQPVWFQSLYVNGHRAERARSPATGFFQVAKWRQTSETNAAGKVSFMQTVVIHHAAANALTGLTPDELQTVELQSRVKWSYGCFSVRSWDPAKRELKVCSYAESVKSWKDWTNPHNLFRFVNVRHGLAKPGSWFYDRIGGRVWYRPRGGEKIAASQILAPTAQLVNVMRLAGDPVNGKYVTDMTFEGLTFALSRTDGDRLPSGFVQQYQQQAACHTEGCVAARGARRVAFERCRVTHTENYAIRFDIGCVSNRIVGCELTDLGAGGVMVGDIRSNYWGSYNNSQKPVAGRPMPYGDPLAAERHPCAFITVDDCLIEHAGRVNPEACGILMTHVSDSSVTHCEIRDLYYTGISLGWTWGYSGSLAQRNTIAFNRVENIGQGEMSDMGGVYTLGTSFGTVISNNVFCGISSSGYGGWGLYNDEGSEGIVWENNLVYDTQDASYHQHYGRNNVVRNNILACAKKCQLAVSRAEPHRSVTFERNIVYWEEDAPVYKDPMWMRGIVDGTSRVDWKNNIFWCAGGPTVINASHPAIVLDPLFVNAKARDFRFRDASAVRRFGFKPWDVSLSGRKSGRSNPASHSANDAAERR